MVVLSPCPVPESGIVHQEPLTEAYIQDKCYGSGTLFITESDVLWVGSEGTGFKLCYPNISIHAVSRDTSAFPHQCLYMMLDTALEEPMIEEVQESSDDENSESDSSEVRFVPSEKEHLDVMYRAMCACQELHPDPEQDDSEDEFYGEGSLMTGDGPQLSAEGLSNLHRMEQMLANGGAGDENGHHQEEMDDETENGQFEDP